MEEGDQRAEHGVARVVGARQRAVRQLADVALGEGGRSAARGPGEQKPRGWGLFLIRNMVDSMDVTADGSTQTVTLTMARKEPSDG